MQIRKRLPIIMNMLICIPLIVLAIVIYVYSSRELIQKSENYINKLTVAEGRALTTLIEAKTYQVKILAGEEKINKVVQDNCEENDLRLAAAYLKEALNNNDDYEIVVLNQKGKVVVTATGENEKIRLRSKEGFEKVLTGETSYTDMLFSYLDNNKVINITVPIKNREGKVIGAVCKVISNDVFSEFADTVQIGKTGYAFIFNEAGYVIAHPDKEEEGLLLSVEELRKSIRQEIDENKKTGNYIYTYKHQKKYAVFFLVPDINWVISISQNVSEMQQEAITGCILIMVTLLILIVIIYFVSKRLARRITKPMDLLMEAMASNMAGHLDRFCSYKGNDEFGILSNAYNEMVKQLGDSHYNLNVACKELENTKQELQNNYSALEKSKEALVISEKRYKTTLEAIDEGIWEYNLETKKFVATENLNRILGTKLEEESIQRVIDEIMEVQFAANFLEKVNRCIAGEIGDFTQEISASVQGQKRWLLCKGHAINIENKDKGKLIGILTDITDNKENEEQVRKLSYFDGLTGCLNKATFIGGLDAWLGTKDYTQDSVLLFIDLDNFKRINDTMGHEVGDKILNYVGKLLRDILPQEAFIGRFGGDEFVIFKPQVLSMDEIHELIYDILNHFKNKIVIGKTKVHVTCSMGVAVYPVDGEDSAMLLKNADTAMYKAKDNGKNSYSFYAPAMTQKLDRRLLIEEALREAIGKQSFHLQYQPIVDVKKQKTIGCEALVRMMDSELGFISPGEFIPIAEETDLIIEAGDWVLENALSALRYYHSQGYGEFYMNINVSSMQIKEENFLEKLVKTIEEAHVPTEYIKLEVTESVLMENITASIQLFKEIRALGIKIALDDFGTGYSSLNYLRSLPLDILKIDKSFIDEITTSKVLSEIVDSIINMAHALGIVVVAEGVETGSQFDILRDKGCDLIQGFYFSKPLDSAQLEEKLRKEYGESDGLDRIS